MPATWPRVPYGWADFRAIRLEQRLYIDKTRFLHALEEERYAFLIRPRRMGKSCWVSLLENYYDRMGADEFKAVFGGTDIGRNPTENRHRYVVLRFDFSTFKNALDTLERYFEEYCQLVVRHTLERNADLFPEAARRHIRSSSSVNGQLNELFLYAGDHGIPLYVLIDEYDNFANTVLAYHGAEAYQSFTHGGGFYRNFFATLKAGAGRSRGGLERLFITGVSPITLDDVTSGFNIGRNISLRPEFNDMLGFTEEEVRGLLEMYRDHGVFNQEVEAALEVMREWYNGYRFARNVEGDLYNTDMILYFLNESMPNKPMPDELIDTNVRIDYGKLRHLLTVNRQLNGNFDLLRHIIAEEVTDSDIQVSFPLDRLDRRENFLSLLFYFGLLSIREVVHGVSRLGIPNQTVKRLMYGYLRDAYDDVGVFSVDVYTFSGLVRKMAYERRLAAGPRLPARRPRRADGNSRLPRRRESDPRVRGRPLQHGEPVSAALGVRAEQRVRRSLPGAVHRPVPRHGVRLRGGAEVSEAARAVGRLIGGGEDAGSSAPGARLPRRPGPAAPLSVSAPRRPGDGISRLGAGRLRGSGNRTVTPALPVSAPHGALQGPICWA